MGTRLSQRTKALGVIFSAVAVVLSPVAASAVSNSANTTVSATVNDVISISTSSTVSFTITPTSGGAVSSNSDTVTVSTNKAAGYTLTLADTDATSNLVSGSDTFTPHAGTQVSPTALANGKWGYAVASVGGFDASYSAETSNNSSTSKWAGVPVTGSPNTLKTTSSTATNDTTTVWYAAKANTSQPSGTYTDSVTYTATTN